MLQSMPMTQGKVYKGKARVQYYENYCIAWTDPEIARYYLSLLPKYLEYQSQKDPSHITVCRKGIETPDYTNWGYREGESIEFTYDSTLWHEDPYVWLDVWSEDIVDIRAKLGLGELRNGFECYHLTVGNRKPKNKVKL